MLVIGHYKMVWNVWQQEKVITACALCFKLKLQLTLVYL